ncbi:aggrephagy protein [Aureococcus anophagefferens]|uniref:Aggrephagy protein n=1 Tax=Aureococcus anophagefferens TaxID=44056 RepID=A0ABR1FNJ5_AURAN
MLQRALAVSAQYSVLEVPTKKRKGRFSLLQLEHGELFLCDFSGTLSDGRSPATGRLRCCSRSLVFEPNESRSPLLKLPLKHVKNVSNTNAGVAFACAWTVEMFANSVPAPFATKPSPGVFTFAPAHSAAEDLARLASNLSDAAAVAAREGSHVEATLLAQITAPLRVAKFEMSQLVDFRENVVDRGGGRRAVFEGERVSPLLRQPGVVVVTTQRVYFEPAALNNVGDSAMSATFDRVASCRRCRHMMASKALEIELRRPASASRGGARGHRRDGVLRVAFASTAERDACWKALKSRPELAAACVDDRLLSDATRAWQTKELDNFSYLALLNQVADRSLHDLSQYPVFPWVVADYESERLDLDDPKTFRDLTKPVGALCPRRLANFRERYAHMPGVAAPSKGPEVVRAPTRAQSRGAASGAAAARTSFLAANERFRGLLNDKFQPLARRFSAATGAPPPPPAPPPPEGDEFPRAEDAAKPEDAPFLYGTHYSTPGYVLFFLVRCVPEYMLCLQNGKFDAADRMFDSVRDAWTSVRAASTDLKELIPEFYDGDGEFLVNGRNVPLGVTQAGERLGDVKLPPWARNPADFVKRCRAALESDYVSARLHHWIDLVFGCKQRSIDDDNVFHPLTYEGTVDLDKVGEERERTALELQIDEFGQTPRKLFFAPHVRRDGELLETPPPPASESDDDDETVLVDRRAGAA